jgi:hypothetical protein
MGATEILEKVVDGECRLDTFVCGVYLGFTGAMTDDPLFPSAAPTDGTSHSKNNVLQ